MKKSSGLVRGIGVKETHCSTVSEGNILKEYYLWNSMLGRCTKKYQDRFPTYIGVTCSENFKSYEYFYHWCNRQLGFNIKDEKGRCWNIDKDFLIKGNKVYSEDTCVFLPQRVNLLVNRRNNARGEHSIGVIFRGNKFHARCCIGESVKAYLGSFVTEQEAFQAYKTFKEALIKDVANEYKEQLDLRVYEALMNYEVNRND